MNRYDRVAEHLDLHPIQDLGFCQAEGRCACRGMAGCSSVNGGPVREHELIKYIQGKLLPGQIVRQDIWERIREELSKHGAPADFIEQYDYIKDGRVWGNYIHRHEKRSIDIQITGVLPGQAKLHIIEYYQP